MVLRAKHPGHPGYAISLGRELGRLIIEVCSHNDTSFTKVFYLSWASPRWLLLPWPVVERIASGPESSHRGYRLPRDISYV